MDLTKSQLKRLAVYLEKLRTQIREPYEFVRISERKRKNALMKHRNYVLSLTIIEHYVKSHIPNSGVKYNERPNFRRTKI